MRALRREIHRGGGGHHPARFQSPSVGASVMAGAKPIVANGKELGAVYSSQQKGDKQ